jgi:type I restriction enzyme S subunit
MSSDWQTGKLGDFIELKRGYDLPQANRQLGNIPLVSSSGISDFQAESKVKGPGVITGRYGTIGQVYFVAEDYWPLNTTLYVRDFKGNDAKFISYFLKTLDFLAYSDKAAVPGVNRNHLHEALVTIPCLATQKEIAAFLSTLDDRISLLRETNTTLEAIAQALFKSWFVDFDPVRTKMEGREPEGMDADTASLFPDSFDESELGLVPKGWQWDHLETIATVIMGLSPKGDSYNYNAIGVPLINGPVEFGEYFPVQTKWTDSASRLARKDDLIFCVRGSTTGRRVVSDREYCIGRGVCAIRANKHFSGFIYQTINFGLDRLLSKTTGSVFPSLSSPDIKGFNILNPKDSIINTYESATIPILNRIQENHRQARTLATLRDTLLPRLISGQLRLPDVEALIEEATA